MTKSQLMERFIKVRGKVAYHSKMWDEKKHNVFFDKPAENLASYEKYSAELEAIKILLKIENE